MKLKITVNEKIRTNTGKATVEVVCEHCGHCGGSSTSGFLYSLKASLRKNSLETRATMLANAINEKSLEKVFEKATTAKALMLQLCHCDENVVDLERVRGTLRAKEILRAGIIKLKEDSYHTK